MPELKDISKQNIAKTTLSPFYKKLVKGYSLYKEQPESESIREIIKDFFNRVPEEQKNQYLHFSKNSY